MSDEVRYDVDGAVATLTINRPEAMNAMSVPAKVGLLDAVRTAGAEPAVRAVVLTGAGDRAFCAGEDIRALREQYEAGAPPSLADTLLEHYHPIVLGLTSMPKPVIAAVNGIAAGAGAALAFACDFRFAARSASFLTAFASIGLTGDSGISWTLPRLVGPARASAMLMLPEKVEADRALELGLVNAVVPDDALQASVLELAGRLAAGPTLAYAAIKESVGYGATAGLADTLAVEARLQDRLGHSEDHVHAVSAFFAKQKPTFAGR
jgi:2-(1,2-epoxy-1,2-dihydrophenyl)acetyl-CoA isomerase